MLSQLQFRAFPEAQKAILCVYLLPSAPWSKFCLLGSHMKLQSFVLTPKCGISMACKCLFKLSFQSKASLATVLKECWMRVGPYTIHPAEVVFSVSFLWYLFIFFHSRIYWISCNYCCVTFSGATWTNIYSPCIGHSCRPEKQFHQV